MFSNVKIQTQLYAGFGIIIFLMAILIYISISKMHTLAAVTADMHNSSFAANTAIRTVHVSILKVRLKMRDLALTPEGVDIEPLAKEVDELDNFVEEQMQFVNERFSGDKTHVTHVLNELKSYKAARDEIFNLRRAHETEKAFQEIMHGKGGQYFKQAEEQLVEITDYLSTEADRFYNAALETRSQANFLVFMVAGISIIFSMLTAFFVARLVSQKLRNTINLLSSTSTEIAATIEEHERTAALQASSVNETTTTMDQLNATSRQSATQATAAVSQASEVLALVDAGTRQVNQTKNAAQNLKEKVGGIAVHQRSIAKIK